MAHRIQLPEFVIDGWRAHNIAGIGLDNQVYLFARSYKHAAPKMAIFRGSRYVPKSWRKILEIEVKDMLTNDFNDYFMATLSNDNKHMAIITHGEFVNPKFHLFNLNTREGMSFALYGRKGSCLLIHTVLGWTSYEYSPMHSFDSDSKSVHKFYRIDTEVKLSITVATAQKSKDVNITYRFLFAYNFKRQMMVLDMLNLKAEWRVFDMYNAPATNLHTLGNDLVSLRALSRGYQISQVILDTDTNHYRFKTKGTFAPPGYPHLLNEQNWIGITTDEHNGVLSNVTLVTKSHWKPFTLKELCTMKIQKMFGRQVGSEVENITWTNGILAEDLKKLFNYKLKKPFA